MKLRVLIIATVLAVFVCGAVFPQTDSVNIEYNTLIEQVNAYIETGDYAAAIPLLKRMHELKPEELIPVEYLGILYCSLPEERPAFTNALYWLAEAEKRGSSNTSIYYDLACIYSFKEDIKKTEAAMNKALVLGYSNFEWISRDDYLVNFRTGSWWKEIADNYTRIEQQLDLFNEFALTEKEKSVKDRITFYSGIVTALKELAPHIPAMQCLPLVYLAISYKDIVNYTLAEQNYLEAKAVYEKVLGKDHPDYALSLNGLGTLYHIMGDYAKAERYFLEAKAAWEQTLNKNYYNYAAALNNLGALYEAKGDYDKAEPYYLETKTILEQVLGKTHPDYAFSLNNLGVLYSNMGDYAKAEPYFLEAKAVREQTLGKNHPYYAASLINLGALYKAMGNYAKAEPYFLEAKIIIEQVLGKGHPDYATSLSSLGNLYEAMENYVKAELYYLEAKNIREQALGKNHPSYAASLHNLGSLYTVMGDYAKAEPYYLEGKTVREKALGKNHPDYASSLNSLGVLYWDMGDYAQAEPYYLEAKTVREQALGKNHPDYAQSLNNLGHLYISMGDYAKAESCLLEAKIVREQALGKNHPSYALSLNNLGGLYWTTGDYAKTELYYLEAKDIYEQVLGKSHTSYARSLHNLGALYRVMGDYAKAEPYYLEAKDIREQALGKNHPDYANSLINLGQLYGFMGDYAKAEDYCLEAKTIMEQALGKNHPSYASLLNDIRFLYLGAENYIKAETCNKELCELRISLINQNFSFMSEQQRSLYLKTVSQNFEVSYSLSREYPVETVNGLNYTNTLFTKGILLRTNNAIRDAIYSSGNAVLIGQYEQLGRLHKQINQLQQQEDASEAYLHSLEEQADALDKELTRASSTFRDLKEDMAMQWQNVRNSLQQGEAAVEFVSFRIYDKKWTNTTQYAALVLKPDSTAPVWVPLCDEEALQEILGRASGRSSSQQARILYNANGLELFEALWEPLEKELGGVTTIYYSPSGLLHKIAFNALPIDDSYNVRLADKYVLNLVSSTREVVHLNRSAAAAQISSAVLYGGLDYNADAKKMRKAASSYKKDETKRVIASVPPEAVTRGGAWVPLPATRKEVLAIQGYLKKKKIPNTLYKDSLGNEESFRQLDGKKTGLIHLATHGFFLADVERKYDEKEQQQRGNALKAAENPLLRSGLLLAGGNHAWTNNPVEGVESGILTADKIADMNLLGTKLVVMSACQTGLGDVKNGEGVFGLQRAFKLAGVETLVMSLWEVDDAATAKLMSVFYQEWLFSGKSRQEAFKEAQRQVRAEYSLPFYWAAFVMMD